MWGSPESWYTLDRKPDESFCRKLAQYDDKLFVRWNNPYKRFEIWRHVKQGAWNRKVHIMPVKHSKLDNRTLQAIKECDLWQYGRKPGGKCNDYWRDIDNYNDHVELQRELSTTRMAEGLASDELWWRARRHFGSPKSRALWATGGIGRG